MLISGIFKDGSSTIKFKSSVVCSVNFFLDLDDGIALKQLLVAEKALFQNNYPQVVLTHAVSSMAANYSTIIERYEGCSIPFLKGQPVSGKTTALKAALGVFGIHRFISGKYIYYIENNTWVRGNTRFISSVEHDISRVSAANE
jgi:hypothetical protein